MPIYNSAQTWPRRAADCKNTDLLNRVVMAEPSHFDILESINAHMRDGAGNLHKIDKAEAARQWNALVNAYKNAGIDVSILPAMPGKADFCFAANPSLVLALPDGGREMWLSKMANPSRRGEEAAHAKFAKEHAHSKNITIREMPAHVHKFEGTGDAIIHPGRWLIHAGVGPRSERAAWDALAAAHPDLDILVYSLTNEHFYHLDTALAPLGETAALFVKEAFDAAGLELLNAAFPILYQIPLAEAMRFAGNAHSPDGKHVFIQKGCGQTERWLRDNHYVPIAVETSEFIKSGGSVFCLKLSL
ncbi:MAG: dimethylarginine dimethylaminohydrolase family protein [Planctomycetota bacterium]